jgi:non-heme chloroperoxidase
MRFTSGTRPAEAKWRGTSRATGLAEPGRARGRVAKAVFVGAVPPLMLKTVTNPGGLALEVFDGFRAALLADRAQFFRDVSTGPFFGFNRPGAKVSKGLIDNWWRQGIMCGGKAAYD